jgi:hypothetical protein
MKTEHLHYPPSKRALVQDQQLACALFALLFVYSAVTLGVYWKVSAPSIVLTTATTNQQQAAALNGVGNEQQAPGVVKGGVPNPDAIRQLQQTFPVHAGNDLEEIDHSGLEYTDPDKRPTDIPNKFKVPRFWHPPPEAYGGDIRQYLGEHGDKLISKEQALSVGSFQDGKETIYVSIASYRDPECAPTLESIYLRAKYPERLRVAVIDQRIDGDDLCLEATDASCAENPHQEMCKYRHLIDIYQVDARLAVGPVFARHLGHRMYRGEYFAMQIDSHVRFVQDWDEDLVGQWKSAHNEMCVLTTYLSDIIGSIDPRTNKSIHPDRPIMCASDYEGGGAYRHLRHGQQPEGMAGIQGTPTLHPFWAAGFSFARGHFVVQIPYDQHLPMVFQGEEISIGLRGFTYGYDYYAAERSVCFHMYAIGENKEKRSKVKLFWENSNRYPGAAGRAMKRLNGIIGMPNSPNEVFDHTEEFKYGLGKVRTIEKFFKTFGIHTETKTVEQHLCTFVGKPMQKVFIPHLRPDGMGLDYSKIDYVFVDPEKAKPPSRVK